MCRVMSGCGHENRFDWQDICSLECKGRRLKKLGLLDDNSEVGVAECESGEFGEGGESGEGGEGWRYRPHPEVASWSEEQVATIRREVCDVCDE